MSDADRDKIVAASEASGRSMSEEIEWRVEESFRQEEITEAVREAVREAAARDATKSVLQIIEVFFGGKQNMEFGQIMAQSLRLGMKSVSGEISDYKELRNHPDLLRAVEQYLQNRISEELTGKSEWEHLKVRYDAFADGVSGK